jgi:hypothetical protein
MGSDIQKMTRDNTIEAEKPSETPSSKADEPKKTYRRCPRCKKHTIETTNTGGLDAQIEDRYNQLIPSPSPPLKVHPEFRHYMPPDVPVYGKFSLFTAGSIEMGAAIQWQQRLVEHLQDLPLTVTNPRRGQWDPAVDAKAKDPKFRGQVIWELDALTAATVICYFFDVDTISPVTLMELGLWAHSGKIIVCCKEEFWREGNVKLVCERYNIPFVRSFEMLVPAVKEMLERKGMQLDKDGNLVGGNHREHQPEEFKAPQMKQEDMWWLKYQEAEEKKRLEAEEKNKAEGTKDG